MQHEPNEPFEPKKMMISDLLSAISETEYPQYLLDALTLVQNWMQETLGASADGVDNGEQPTFPAMFESNEEDVAAHIDALFERLRDLEELVNIIPNSTQPDGKPDAIIVNVTPLEYESGLRPAIDYAALFNRRNSKRVWIVSDTFVFEDVVRYSAHVDALAEQGISLRFILVTPWGWVEMPLSGESVSRQQFLMRLNHRGNGRNK